MASQVEAWNQGQDGKRHSSLPFRTRISEHCWQGRAFFATSLLVGRAFCAQWGTALSYCKIWCGQISLDRFVVGVREQNFQQLAAVPSQDLLQTLASEHCKLVKRAEEERMRAEHLLLERFSNLPHRNMKLGLKSCIEASVLSPDLAFAVTKGMQERWFSVDPGCKAVLGGTLCRTRAHF